MLDVHEFPPGFTVCGAKSNAKARCKIDVFGSVYCHQLFDEMTFSLGPEANYAKSRLMLK